MNCNDEVVTLVPAAIINRFGHRLPLSSLDARVALVMLII
jgi:hypothetical protein